jgi:hypothetical protein
MAKYTYETVRIELKSGFVAMKAEEDYREVIRRYAEEGWRLVQAFAPPLTGYGLAQYIDLIFEKEI